MRRVSVYMGVLLLVGLIVLLVSGGNEESFTVHMLVHMGVVAVASPLIAIGLVDTKLNPLEKFPAITPLTASLAELLLVWLWHVPAMRRLSESALYWTAFEQLMFLAGGLALWLTCFSWGGIAGTVGLLFTSMHMTLLGVLLSLAPRPLYGTENVSCFGIMLDPTTDQQIGGVIMLLIGAVSYLVGGVALLAVTLRPDTPDAWRKS